MLLPFFVVVVIASLFPVFFVYFSRFVYRMENIYIKIRVYVCVRATKQQNRPELQHREMSAHKKEKYYSFFGHFKPPLVFYVYRSKKKNKIK